MVLKMHNTNCPTNTSVYNTSDLNGDLSIHIIPYDTGLCINAPFIKGMEANLTVVATLTVCPVNPSPPPVNPTNPVNPVPVKTQTLNHLWENIGGFLL